MVKVRVAYALKLLATNSAVPLEKLDEQKRANELKADSNTSEQLNQLVHEIRKLNAQIKSQIENAIFLATKGESADQIEYRLKNAFATSSLISVRLNVFDLTTNPALALAREVRIPVYRKFEKVAHCLQSLSSSKGTRIRMNGKSFGIIDGYEIFEILPFVLLENALKYSPRGQDIIVDFTEDHRWLTVNLISVGPRVSDDELGELTHEGFRGKNALHESGTGLGLYVAKRICGYHNINLAFQSGATRFDLNGISYAEFTATLSIPLA